MSLEGVHASGSLEKGDAQRPNVYEPVIDILQYTCAHIKVNGSGSLEEGDAQRPNIHEPLAGGVHYALGRKVTPCSHHRGSLPGSFSEVADVAEATNADVTVLFFFMRDY